MSTVIESTPDSLQRDVQSVYDRIGDEFAGLQYRDLMLDVIADLEELHLQYFQREAGPEGSWPALAPSTVRRKGHAGILWERTRLMASLLDANARDAVREVYDEGRNAGLSFGTSTPYAGYHMTGTRNMPARPMVGITEPEVEAIVERTLDYAVGELFDV